MNHIYLEISDVVNYITTQSSVTGIQRVILSILNEFSQREDIDRYMIAYQDPSTLAHKCFPLSHIKDIDFFDTDILRHVFGLAFLPDRNLPKSLRKYAGKPEKLKFHSAVRQANATIGRERHFQKRGETIADWKTFKQKIKQNQSELHVARPKTALLKTSITPRDDYVILGAFWHMFDLLDMFKSLHHRQIRVSILIHDLVPVKAPAYVVSDFVLLFLKNLEQIMTFCRSYLTVSHKTKEDLSEFLKEYDVTADIRVLPLAQQSFADSDRSLSSTKTADYIKSTAGLRKDVLILTERPYVLCVGTLEARKNNLGLAQAWNRLQNDPQLQNLDLPRLVFAGRSGWFNDPFFDWMEASGYLGGGAQFVEKPSDADLAYLYQHCEFTVFPSFYEGWGLPVGESLSYGKTAVVSNVSSLPEVGQDMVLYCNPRSPIDIAEKCRLFLTEPGLKVEYEDRIKRKKLRSWTEVSSDLSKLLAT